MKRIQETNKYLKDLEKISRRGKNIEKLLDIILCLSQGNDLPRKNMAHRLSGKWSNSWECHIEPDWLLIYDITDEFLILRRTGTHSDLF